MPQTIHVIKPSGTRFQYTFPDTAPPEKILAELGRIKVRFGYNGVVTKTDPNAPALLPTDFEDPESGFAFDDPKTVVAVIEDRGGAAVEVRRLRGPSPEPVSTV